MKGVNKIPTVEQKRQKALDVTANMQKLLTVEFYPRLNAVANTTDANAAKGLFKALCKDANVKGDMKKYLWTILRDKSIKGAHNIDMDDVDGLDASFCWS